MKTDAEFADAQEAVAEIQESSIEAAARQADLQTGRPLTSKELAAACARCMIDKAVACGEEVKLSVPGIVRCVGANEKVVRQFVQDRVAKGQLEETDPPVWLEIRSQPPQPKYYTLTSSSQDSELLQPEPRSDCPTPTRDLQTAISNFRAALYAFPHAAATLACVRCQMRDPAVRAGEAPITTDSLERCTNAWSRAQANRVAQLLVTHGLLRHLGTYRQALSIDYLLTPKGALVLDAAESPECKRPVEVACDCPTMTNRELPKWVEDSIIENYEEPRQAAIRERLREFIAGNLVTVAKTACQKNDAVHELARWHAQTFKVEPRWGRLLVPGERLLALSAAEQRAFFHVTDCELLVYGNRLLSANILRMIGLTRHAELMPYVDSVIFPKIGLARRNSRRGSTAVAAHEVNK